MSLAVRVSRRRKRVAAAGRRLLAISQLVALFACLGRGLRVLVSSVRETKGHRQPIYRSKKAK